MKLRFPIVLMSVLIVLSMALTACAPAAATESAAVATEAPAATEAVATDAAAAEPVTITFWHSYNADVEAKFLDEIAYVIGNIVLQPAFVDIQHFVEHTGDMKTQRVHVHVVE